MTHSFGRLIAIASALSLSAAAVQAQGTNIVPGANEGASRVGTRGANFLHVPVGARQVGLAGAAVGLSEGPGALFWNPANVASQQGAAAFISYMQLFGNSGITNTAGAFSIPFGQGAFGFGIVQYHSGDIVRTTERAPDGDDPTYGAGTFAWKALSLSAHYARNVTDRLTAAVGIRRATEGIDYANNSYVGIDVATRFRTGLYGLTVAAALSNVGSRGQFQGAAVGEAISAPRNNGQATGRDLPISYDTQDPLMPTWFNFGVVSRILGDADAFAGANESHSLAAEIDFKKAIDTDLQTALGVEYAFRRAYFLRVGKRFFNEQHSPWKFEDGVSFGAGARFPVAGRSLSFDYGFAIMGELRSNQILSFEIGQ